MLLNLVAKIKGLILVNIKGFYHPGKCWLQNDEQVFLTVCFVFVVIYPNFFFFAGEDQIEDGKKQETIEIKKENKIDRVKRAAVTAISAVAVKAKLLANQEEDQIRQLAAFLIEKQVIF
jgi:hypothetical protein